MKKSQIVLTKGPTADLEDLEINLMKCFTKPLKDDKNNKMLCE